MSLLLLFGTGQVLDAACRLSDGPHTPLTLTDTTLTGTALTDRRVTPVAVTDAPLNP